MVMLMVTKVLMLLTWMTGSKVSKVSKGRRMMKMVRGMKVMRAMVKSGYPYRLRHGYQLPEQKAIPMAGEKITRNFPFGWLVI